MYTENNIIEECNKKNLNYKRIEYNQYSDKRRRCVIYTCNNHEKYGEQTKVVEKLFSTKKPCVYCNHSRLDIILQDEVKKINPNIVIIGDYINTDTPITCKCTIHNEEWKTRPLDLLKGKVGCPECLYIKKHNNSKIKSVAQFKEEVKAVNPNLEFVGEYYNTHTLTDFKCLIHNIIFQSLPCNILNQTATCPICSKESLIYKEGLKREDLIKAIKENDLQMEIIDDNYTNNKVPIKCRCLIHNIIYYTQPRNFLYRHSSGCPECYQSSGEYKLGKLLDKMGFDVTPQYSFKDCRYKKKLRFDYYDETNNIAFEYQGEQHYRPVNFGGMSNEKAIKDFQDNQKRDSVKKQYCFDNNIKLVCVPYWEYDNMEHFLIKNI